MTEIDQQRADVRKLVSEIQAYRDVLAQHRREMESLRTSLSRFIGPMPQQGLDRCACGCKYWDSTTATYSFCIDCLERYDGREWK